VIGVKCGHDGKGALGSPKPAGEEDER
jgi:hypothetical protein